MGVLKTCELRVRSVHNRGVVYVAYGNAAIREASKSIISLRRHNNYNVYVICGKHTDIPGVSHIIFDNPGKGARWAKLNMDLLVDYGTVCYLDADTRVNERLDAPFKMVEAGWDLIMTPSVNQGGDTLRHIDKEERKYTLEKIMWPLQLQAGVMFFNRERCTSLFEAWRSEWQRYKDQDQAAFTRALHREPVKIGLLGRDWNGGNVVEHLFGRARG